MRTIRNFLLVTFILPSIISNGQRKDSIQKEFHLKGLVTLTNKGISLVPTFTLGKPAAIFDLSMGKKKLFFEPQLRFSLKGKPWSFLFWWRYKLLTDKKFTLTLGGHPAINFKTETEIVNGVLRSRIVGRRYLAGELAPNYHISKNLSAGFYYLYAWGIDFGTAKNNHFLTVNVHAKIRLGEQYAARLVPQFYYLNQDGKDGFYFTTALTLSNNKCPISVQSIINKTIRSNVPGSENFLINFSVLYSFGKTYVRQS